MAESPTNSGRGALPTTAPSGYLQDLDIQSVEGIPLVYTPLSADEKSVC